MNAPINPIETPPIEQPLAELERQLIREYLAGAGEDVAALMMRTDDEARQRLAEASRHASAKLGEIEAKSHYVRELHGER